MKARWQGACSRTPENCRVVGPTAIIAMGDDSILGFSGADVLAELNSASPGSFEWASAEATTLHLVASGGTAEVWASPLHTIGHHTLSRGHTPIRLGCPPCSALLRGA